MTSIVAVSGKGGTGKTSISAMFLKYLIKKFAHQRIQKNLLIIDVDPASNIPEVIGIETEIEKTLSKISYNLKQKIQKGEIPRGVDKGLTLESDLYEIIYENHDYDLLVMGRGEGKGCYCYLNDLLKNILDPLEKNYDIILMDMPAGLEHLSRRTDRDVDDLVIVTDMSKMGLNTAERIIEIAKEVHIDFKKFWIVGNRFDSSMMEYLTNKTAELKEKYNVNIEFAGFIPADNEIAKANLEGTPIINIPDNNPAYIAAKKIAEKVFGN
ncbi:MAG: nucleotide-binding protein [Promethearchaeota archaeon]